MRITRTIRMNKKHLPGQVKLFNLTGPDRSAKSVADSKLSDDSEEKQASTDWSKFYQRGRAEGRDPLDMHVRQQAIEQHVARGGQDPSRGGLGRVWGNITNPSRVHHAGRDAQNRAMMSMAHQYEQMGLDPEQSMLRAQRALGRKDFRESVDDQVYQTGSAWQHLSNPTKMLDARARQRVRGGQGGGGLISGLDGVLLNDYFGGQKREQQVARQDATENFTRQRRLQQQHMNRHIARQDGSITDMDAQRDRRSAQFGGQTSAMDDLQLARNTADWRRRGGVRKVLPWGSRKGEQSRFYTDAQHAQYGRWSDLSRPARWGQRFGAWLTGREHTGHKRLMQTHDGYRKAVEGLSQGGYQEGADLTGIIQGSRGREGVLWDVGRRDGVDMLDTLGGDKGFRQTMDRLATGQISAEQSQRILHGLGDITGEQRERLGIDKAMEQGLDPRQRRLSSGWMNMSDQLGRDSTPEQRGQMFARRSRPKPVDLDPSASDSAGGSVPGSANKSTGAHGKDRSGSTNVIKTSSVQPAHNWAAQAGRTPSPYNLRTPHAPHQAGATGTAFDQSDSARRMAGQRQAQYAHQQWNPHRANDKWRAQQALNPFRPYEGYNPYDPESERRGFLRRLGGGIGRTFMSEGDIRAYDPGVRHTQQQIRAGKWQPGMNIDQAATGTGWRAVGDLTDWLGLTTSPEQQAQTMRRKALASPQMQQLEAQYQRGEISPEQFQRASGGSLRQMYGSDPQRFAQMAGKAQSARRGLAIDSMVQQAAQHRRKALGSHAAGFDAI